MDEHARRHDPDQIVRPVTHSVPAGQAHREPSTDDWAPQSRHATPPASVPASVTPVSVPASVTPAYVPPPTPAAYAPQDGTSQQGGFWRSLTTIERAEILATAQEVAYPAGAVLWEEGQAADHTVVIKSGSVRVSVQRDGRERIIAFRGPGDIVGERAALLLRRRSATIVAMAPLHALRLTTREFVTYLSNHPRVVAVLEREMYDRLTEQSGGAHDPRLAGLDTERHRAAHAYGAAVHYGSPQPYATVYVPMSPQWAQDPYGKSGPYGGFSWQAASGPYVEDDACPAAESHARGWPGMAEASDGSWEPHGAAADGGSSPAHTKTVASPSGGAPSWAGQNCTVVFTDIAGFSSHVRNEDDRIAVRRAMYAALRESFEESKVPWDACYREDRGDGALIVIPPEMPTAAVVDPMLALLGTRLRRHNHRSSEAVRIQLRVAVDVGPVEPDPPGIAGWTVITAARLLDAAPLKERLAATGADLGVIASRFVYDSVIAHGPGYVNADEYEPIGCKVKETDIEGWIHLRGLPAASAL